MSFPVYPDADAKILEKTGEGSILRAKVDHVMTFGTFDLYHPGHTYYLSEAHRYGEHMTVIIARDHRVESGKGRVAIDDEQTRLRRVQEAFPEAQVILGHETDIYAPIRELQPDMLVFGYDQRVPEDRIREMFPSIELRRVGGYETHRYKSSILRQSI